MTAVAVAGLVLLVVGAVLILAPSSLSAGSWGSDEIGSAVVGLGVMFVAAGVLVRVPR